MIEQELHVVQMSRYNLYWVRERVHLSVFQNVIRFHTFGDHCNTLLHMVPQQYLKHTHMVLRCRAQMHTHTLDVCFY